MIDSDDGSVDGEVERERDAFSYRVQQRKRMLRLQGQSVGKVGPRSKPRAQEKKGYFILVILFSYSLYLVEYYIRIDFKPCDERSRTSKKGEDEPFQLDYNLQGINNSPFASSDPQ